MDSKQATVYSYEPRNEQTWPAFITAMRSGAVVEIDQEMFDYWLEVLPPIFMSRRMLYRPMNSAEQVDRYCSFGFAEGAEEVVMFWQEGSRYFCQCSQTMNPFA